MALSQEDKEKLYNVFRELLANQFQNSRTQIGLLDRDGHYYVLDTDINQPEVTPIENDVLYKKANIKESILKLIQEFSIKLMDEQITALKATIALLKDTERKDMDCEAKAKFDLGLAFAVNGLLYSAIRAQGKV